MPNTGGTTDDGGGTEEIKQMTTHRKVTAVLVGAGKVMRCYN